MKCSKTNRAIDEELYNACANGTVQEVERLIGLGADPSAPHWEKPWPEDLDENIYTEDYYCVHEAAMNPDIGVLDLLIEHGAEAPNQLDVNLTARRRRENDGMGGEKEVMS